MATPPSSRRIREIRELFERLSEMPESAQKACLDEVGEKDPELRQEVEALLQESKPADEAFSRLSKEIGDSHIREFRENPDQLREVNKLRKLVDPEAVPGALIGAYKLIREIGEGGFGTVWLAEQKQPIRRQVALKLLKAGMDSKEVIARFEGERQALALMQHANIAHVLDAGTTEKGRPYFVMEYVQGEPLNQFCRKHRLPLKARLQLFMEICEAIQHAHQKGVIHRDLKPGNVLVRFEDGPGGQEAVPKVIDFGVAKAVSTPLTDKTLFTGISQLIGTPVYMSPEQADLGAGGLDTRSDIYSLGVMLYELVTGFLPFEQATFKNAAMGEIQRLLREVDPPKPSTRLRSLQTSADPVLDTSLSALQTDFSSLEQVLRSDLDWVVLKCLEKDRNRRYETAHGLALDIRRYLKNEPLQAGPPTAMYRIRKYIRRHKAGVIAASLVLTALLLGLVGTTTGLIEARKARLAEAEQRRQAEDRSAELQMVTEFQQSVFDRLQPEQIGAAIFREIIARYGQMLEAEGFPKDGQESRLGALQEELFQLNPTDIARQTFNNEVLEQSSEAIAEEFAGQPLVEAALRESLARAYAAIGLPDRARGEQKRAIELRLEQQGTLHPDTQKAKLAQVDFLLQAKVYPSAKELAQSLLEFAQEAPELPEDLLPRVLLALGRSEYRNEDWDVAEKHLDEAYSQFREILGESHPLTLEAEFESVQALRHFDYNVGYNSLLIGGDMGNVAMELEPRYRELVAKVVRELGEDHPLTWRVRQYYAESLALMTWAPLPENAVNELQNEWNRKAKVQLDAVLASQKKALGALHPTTLQTRKTLLFYSEPGDMTPTDRRAEVEELESILETEIGIWGENHPSVVETLSRIARKLDDYGLPDESISATRRAIRIHKRLKPDPNLELADLYFSLSDRLIYQHLHQEAFDAAKACLETADQLEMPPGKLRKYRARYIQSLESIGELKEAERLIEAWEIPQLADVNLLLQGRWDELVQGLEDWVAKKEAEGGIPIDYRQAWNYSVWAERFSARDMQKEADFWWEKFWECRKLWGELSPQKSAVDEAYSENSDLSETELARLEAEAFEAGREEWMKNPPSFWSRARQFPYGAVNPYFAEESFLLQAAFLWEEAGEPGKADHYIREYLAFRERIQNEGDPELLAWYEDITGSEFGARTMWQIAPILAEKGHFKEAEWHFTRVFDQPVFRWWLDPEIKRNAYKGIISFYQQWNEADPEGGHLQKIARWQKAIDEIDAEYAKWEALSTARNSH